MPARAPAVADRQCTSYAKTVRRQCSRNAQPGSDRCGTHAYSPGSSLARRTPAHVAVTASAATVSLEGVAWQTWRFGARAWQAEAWRLYDLTGQLHFVSGWLANSVSRCRLYVAEVDEAGEAGEEAADRDIASLAAVPLGSGPAKDEALRLLTINLFVPGEAYIIVQADAGLGGDDLWMVVSGRQISRTGDQITVRRPMLHGGGDMLYRPGLDLIIRCWAPHPADSDEPDSPTRSALPDLREIEALRKREYAELDSRLAGAGILLLPQGIDFPRGPDDSHDAAEGFEQILQRAMATSLRDRSSAAALVPITATVPPEVIDKIKHLTLWSELSAQILPLKEAAIRSLAQSLDIPAEILTGVAEANHWSGWLVSEDAIRTQIVPILSRIADALTTGYLRGALEEMGEDPAAYTYAFDTSPLTQKPNRTQDALSYYGEGLISAEAAVEAGAFRDDQMPNEVERLRRLAERMLMGSPALATAVPALLELVGIEAPPPAPAPVEEEEAPTENDEPEQGPDEEGPPGTEDDAENPQQSAAVVAVARAAMRRALTLAGGRLVPHRQRDSYGDCPRHELHVKFGAIEALQADKVLAGAWDDLSYDLADLEVDAGRLRVLLHDLAVGLLTRGQSYDPAALRDVITAAVQARLLDAPLGVGG